MKIKKTKAAAGTHAAPAREMTYQAEEPEAPLVREPEVAAYGELKSKAAGRAGHYGAATVGGFSTRGLVPRIAHYPAMAGIAGMAPSTSQLIASVRGGLSGLELDELKSLLEISNETLAPIVGMSKATLARRRDDQRLSPEEGDRVVRYARLFAQALEVMGTAEHARRWLKSPQVGLGGSTPLDYALTEVGAREVEDLLGRIEYGVYT